MTLKCEGESHSHPEERPSVPYEAPVSTVDSQPAPGMPTAAAIEWLTTSGLDACELDDPSPVRAALDPVPSSARKREPACLAVQGSLERIEGHVDAAIGLVEQALALKLDQSLELRIREELGHLFLSRRQDAECDRIIARSKSINPSDPRILSLEMVLRARRRDARALEDLDRLEASLPPLSDLEKARIYRRMASAVYEIRGDFQATERYWNLVIEHAEVAGAHSHAAVAYWGLTYLYSTHVGDIARILHYNDLWTQAAAKAGDKGFLLASLADRFVFAVEIGDKDLLQSLSAQLREVHGPERYAERISLVLGEAVAYGWSGAFDTMRQYLLSVNIGRVINAQQSIYHALTAVAHAGSGYQEEALKSAYRALSQARPLPKEPLHETRMRFIARFLSASVLLRSDRRTEAVRTLNAYENRMTPSLQALRDAILSERYDSVHEKAPDVYGYAMLCASLQRSTSVGDGVADLKLTKREIDILKASSSGHTAKAIAEELGLSETTVEWHRKNLLKKLGVKSTIAAISRGRELQIIQ